MGLIIFVNNRTLVYWLSKQLGGQFFITGLECTANLTGRVVQTTAIIKDWFADNFHPTFKSETDIIVETFTPAIAEPMVIANN